MTSVLPIGFVHVAEVEKQCRFAARQSETLARLLQELSDVLSAEPSPPSLSQRAMPFQLAEAFADDLLERYLAKHRHRLAVILPNGEPRRVADVIAVTLWDEGDRQDEWDESDLWDEDDEVCYDEPSRELSNLLERYRYRLGRFVFIDRSTWVVSTENYHHLHDERLLDDLASAQLEFEGLAGAPVCFQLPDVPSVEELLALLPEPPRPPDLLRPMEALWIGPTAAGQPEGFSDAPAPAPVSTGDQGAVEPGASGRPGDGPPQSPPPQKALSGREKNQLRKSQIEEADRALRAHLDSVEPEDRGSITKADLFEALKPGLAFKPWIQHVWQEVGKDVPWIREGGRPPTNPTKKRSQK